MYDFPYSMMDVLGLLDIAIPPHRGDDITISCPNCKKINKDHLRISLKKDNFHCYSCGFKGGMLALYSYYTGLDTKESNRDILDRLNMNTKAEKIQGRIQVEKEKNSYATENPIASVEHRDKVYRKLLSLLNLKQSHYDELSGKRGLSDSVIRQNLYRSTPNNANFNKELTNCIIKNGLDVKGVPGFYTDENGDWTLIKMLDGFLIPARDENNHIQGFQIRVSENARIKKKYYQQSQVKIEPVYDKSKHAFKGFAIYKGGQLLDKVDEYKDCGNGKIETIKILPKYITLSSKGYENGTPAPASIHFATNYVKKNGEIVPYIKEGRIVITEGGLKGDIFNSITGTPTLCVPGVNNYQLLLDTLKRLISKYDISEVYLGYDMDYLTNENVQLYLNYTKEGIKALGLNCTQLVWNKEYKGIDDYYLFLRNKSAGETL